MTPDLTALAALLAAATGPDGEVLPFADQEHCASDCCDWYPRLHVHGDPAEYQRLVPSLIEAARREAGLLDLIAHVAQMIEPDYETSEQGGRRWIDVDRAYALLHDSAGATGDEVGEP